MINQHCYVLSGAQFTIQYFLVVQILFIFLSFSWKSWYNFFVIFRRINLVSHYQELSMMIRQSDEELQLLVNILSVRVADIAVVRIGLGICERTMDENIESRKLEISLLVWYFSRSALKSPSKTNVLVSRKSFYCKWFVR